MNLWLMLVHKIIQLKISAYYDFTVSRKQVLCKWWRMSSAMSQALDAKNAKAQVSTFHLQYIYIYIIQLPSPPTVELGYIYRTFYFRAVHSLRQFIWLAKILRCHHFNSPGGASSSLNWHFQMLWCHWHY